MWDAILSLIENLVVYEFPTRSGMTCKGFEIRSLQVISKGEEFLSLFFGRDGPARQEYS